MGEAGLGPAETSADVPTYSDTVLPSVGSGVASRAARVSAGRARRDAVPLASHAELSDPAGRIDPLATLQAQDVARVPELVPIRYGRMLATPFTFYRGAAAVMAGDLAGTARTDLHVQLCGDAHLSNFGAFAAPDRRLVVDVNDFDETLPGPFEWDVKRLVASLVVAGRYNGHDAGQTRVAVAETVGAYRLALHLAAVADPLDVWYARVELDELPQLASGADRKRLQRQVRKAEVKATRKDRLRAAAKLTDVVDGRRIIVADPPLIVRPTPQEVSGELERVVAFFEQYRGGLAGDRRTILDRYSPVDVAHKVVGVGSVGTRCWIVLLESGDGDPLFLQFKEATRSVLEEHLGPSEFANSGQRVVEGQQLVQAASDVFLGFARYQASAGTHRDYYFRQLWDGKLSAAVEEMGPKRLRSYGRLCGLVLARAHARSGDAAMISGYLGDDDTFDQAMTAFGEAYADRNLADHERLVAAVDAGELEVDPNH
jgi:uncharacterized protein (DUF2252 family)